MLLGPLVEGILCAFDGSFEALDAKGFVESVIMIGGDQAKLVVKVGEVVIDGCGGEEEDFGG